LPMRLGSLRRYFKFGKVILGVAVYSAFGSSRTFSLTVRSGFR